MDLSKYDIVAFSDYRCGLITESFIDTCTNLESTETYASSQINYAVKPGRMIFFPSYMPHQYALDIGYKPFRFIHWNCQAIPKGVLNVVQK